MNGSTDLLSYPAGEVRRYDRDRFVTALFAPSDRREALFTLYAFNLELAKVPEVVREPMMGRIRIQWWRDCLRAAGNEQSIEHPVAGPLVNAISRYDLDPTEFEQLLDAREEDVEPEPPADMAALEAYAQATGATLVRLASGILGAKGEATMQAAEHVGRAWALTGLLRAAPFHASLGRVYMPLDCLAASGVEPAQLVGGERPAELAEVAREVAAAAVRHLDAARRLRNAVDPRAVPALLLARLADRYLAALARRGYQPFAAGWADTRPRPVLLMLSAITSRY